MKLIESERLFLRGWETEDYVDLFEYASDPQVGSNAGHSTIHTYDEAKKIVANYISNDRAYAIVLKAENKVIGSIGTDDVAPDETLKYLKQRYIGFTINPRYCDNGYATETVQVFTLHLFTEENIELLWSSHFTFNERSKKVIEKCGFEYKFSKDKIVKVANNAIVVELFYNLFNPEIRK